MPYRNTLVAFVVVAFLAISGTTEGKEPDSNKKTALPSCGSGLQVCEPGDQGPGGCWKPGYSNCTRGAVCNSGHLWCMKGSKGPGGCYKPAYSRCDQGKVS
jgi:hypothetical protein